MTAEVDASRDTAAPPALDTHQKALAVNLDATSFGSFAEIGAGQEVARWFLRVGGASGTVAKTISAYDKEVSDDLYGSGTRYVSRQRLAEMLECEWKALLHQVGDARGTTTRFFVFADTVAARNFAGTNDCHGWIGVRFQDRPKGRPIDILLHVNLRDSANLLQQEAVGVLGVNLLHALLIERVDLERLPARLFDSLAESRIEIDQIDVHGNAMTTVDVHALHVALARDGRAEAVAFTAGGAAIAANELLYKKAIVIAPLAAGEGERLTPGAIALCVDELRREIGGDAEVKDVLDLRLLMTEGEWSPRIREASAGAILVTQHRELYRVTGFIRRYSSAPLRFALTLTSLMRIFDETRYQRLDGRMLEALARLFAQDVKVLAYPARRESMQSFLAAEISSQWTVEGEGDWLTADQLRPAPPLGFLYEYLLTTGFLISIRPEALRG